MTVASLLLSLPVHALPLLLSTANTLRRPLTDMPTVPSLPVVGSLPFIGMGKAAGVGPPPHVCLFRLSRVYGDVMRVRMGREDWVVLSSPKAVHEAFVERGGDFSGRPMVPSMAISSGGGQGFARPELDPELKALRRAAYGRLFDAAQVRRAASRLEDEAGRLCDHLVRESQERGGVAVRPALRRAVTNMVLCYAFSTRIGYDDHNDDDKNDPLFAELVGVADDIWDRLTSTQTTMADLLAPTTTNVLLEPPSSRALRRLVRRRDDLLRKIVAQRRRQRRRTSTAAPDMLDALLDAGLPEADVHYTLVDLFVAGVNTVSTSLEWFLLLSTDDPTVQDRARGDPDYARAVVREVLRAKPPLLLPRRAVVDSSIGGHAVPKGTIVLANNHALTHGQAWWDRPEEFRPGRWLEEERATTEHGSNAIDACKYVPYSVGRRVCPGSKLAEAELEAATRVLLHRVRWTGVTTPVDLNEEYSLTLAPTVSQSLRFERIADVI